MMKNNIVHSIMAFLMVLLLLLHVRAFAGAGVGVYGSLSAGKNNLKVVDSVYFERTDNVVSYMTYGCGFVADTNLDGKNIFSYRFRAGYDYNHADSAKTKKLHRVMQSNILAAGVYRDESVRIWIGPQIGLGYLWGSNTYTDMNFIFRGDIPLYNNTLNFSKMNIHLGLVAGININIVKHFTLSVEGGFRYNMYADLDDSSFFTAKRFEDYFPVMGPEGHLSISFMYRMSTDEANEVKTEPVQDNRTIKLQNLKKAM